MKDPWLAENSARQPRRRPGKSQMQKSRAASAGVRLWGWTEGRESLRSALAAVHLPYTERSISGSTVSTGDRRAHGLLPICRAASAGVRLWVWTEGRESLRSALAAVHLPYTERSISASTVSTGCPGGRPC